MPHAIEAATEADLPAIVAIWQAGWQEAHADIVPAALRALRTPESFATRSRAALSGTYVARVAAEVVGFVMVKDDELYQMYVGPAARGTGTAQALIAAAEAAIASAGFSRASLACAIGNARAARFYEKCGWRNAGTETVTLDGGFALEVWRFERDLPGAAHA